MHGMERITPGQLVNYRLPRQAVCRALNVDRTTVWRWAQPVAKGGTGGLVPSRYHAPLLQLAAEHGIALSPAELVLGSVHEVAA